MRCVANWALLEATVGKMRVVRPWHRLPREAVAAPGSLAVFKARLDGALGNLG